jgi:uroporphyrinogen decarboxylase
MLPKEVVLRAIEFREPPRLPLAKGADPDMVYLSYKEPPGASPREPGTDEWGCVWRSFHAADGDQGQVAVHPLEDLARLDGYTFPDPHDPSRFGKARALLDARPRLFEEQFVVASLGLGAIHKLEHLRGTESFLTDFYLNPDALSWILDGVFGFFRGLVDEFARCRADAVIIYDDQAIQSGPLFSMDLWRRHFKPRYSALYARAHDLGLKVYMHSCGNLKDHLVELLHCGVDILDNKQPSLWMQCPEVDRVRGRLCFSSCIDIQSRILTIQEEEIPREVDRIVRRLSTPAGGFVGTLYHQADLGIPAEKNAWMTTAFKAFRW